METMGQSQQQVKSPESIHICEVFALPGAAERAVLSLIILTDTSGVVRGLDRGLVQLQHI